jgi:hypothetical protein
LNKEPELGSVGLGDHASVVNDRVPQLPDDVQRLAAPAFTSCLVFCREEEPIRAFAGGYRKDTPEALVDFPAIEPCVGFAQGLAQALLGEVRRERAPRSGASGAGVVLAARRTSGPGKGAARCIRAGSSNRSPFVDNARLDPRLPAGAAAYDERWRRYRCEER